MEASKSKSDPKMVTHITHNSGTGMVFNLKSGKKTSNQAASHATQPANMRDAFGEDSDE